VTEHWLPISGFPAYEVSNLGRVRSLDRTVSFIRGGIKRTSYLRGRILKATVGSNGYLQVSLSQNADVSNCSVHVLVAAAFIGPRPAGMNVLHEDGNKLNCRASNLYHGDQIDNAQDAIRHGTLARGERVGSAKLTIAEVRIIRTSRANQYDLADRFGVTQGAISFIQRGETWAGLA
jgi:hypothetical protein